MQLALSKSLVDRVGVHGLESIYLVQEANAHTVQKGGIVSHVANRLVPHVKCATLQGDEVAPLVGN
jgi:hypothetical protein